MQTIFTKKLFATAIATGLALSPFTAQAQLLPTTENGFYLMQEQSEDFSKFSGVDVMCITENVNAFVALKQAGEGAVEFIVLNKDDKVSNSKLGLSQPDGGASQIYYKLTEPDSGEEMMTLHFINPGAVGDPAKIPMATWSGIAMLGGKGRCMMEPNIVYLGVAKDRKMMVTADEKGALSLKVMASEDGTVTRTITGGYWSIGKADDMIFSFIDGERLTSIKAAPHERIEYPAWRTTGKNGREYSNSPQAFFAADMAKLGSKSAQLPYGLAVHFERIEICNHLAGEASENAERNKRLKESWDKTNCDQAKPLHASYLKEYANNAKIALLLKAQEFVF